MRISRDRYARLYGPTAGDRFRLADTDLVAEVERDLGVPGEEAVFGGGKTIRDGMAQSQRAGSEGALDLVITNVVVFDPILGIVKGDLGDEIGVGEAEPVAGRGAVEPRIAVTRDPHRIPPAARSPGLGRHRGSPFHAPGRAQLRRR